MENHRHGEDGSIIFEEPSPVEEVTEAAVRIAQIEAERDVTLAKIQAKMVDPELEAENAALRAELETLRAIVSPPAPEVDPEPVVIVQADDVAPEADVEVSEDEETLPEPELVPEETPSKRKSVGLGMW